MVRKNRKKGKYGGKYLSVQLYHEVHDLWPETLTTIGNMSKRHPFVRILQLAEDSAYKNSDKVISMMPYARSHMIAHGMEKEKFIYVPKGNFTYNKLAKKLEEAWAK